MKNTKVVEYDQEKRIAIIRLTMKDKDTQTVVCCSVPLQKGKKTISDKEIEKQVKKMERG